MPPVHTDLSPKPDIVDGVQGTRALAHVSDPNCGEGSLAYCEILSDPETSWQRLTAAGPVERTDTVRLKFQGRTVRLLFTYQFGGDTSYMMTTGPGLPNPVIVVGACGERPDPEGARAPGRLRGTSQDLPNGAPA
jgi:hypothetical protein